MAAGFDINDRSTWAWTNPEAGEFAGIPDDDEYGISVDRRAEFFQKGKDGTAYLHSCPEDLTFDPRFSVCGQPQDCPEDQIYDWAVSKGLVKDQR